MTKKCKLSNNDASNVSVISEHFDCYENVSNDKL